MKKPILNTIAIVSLVSMLSIFSGCGNSSVETETTTPIQTETTVNTTAPTETAIPTENAIAADPTSMDDALFIGDSRTMGLLEYSELKSDFFASVGMSVYNIEKNTISVPSVGKVTLNELLTNKKYGKIYLMIGINELGYDMGQTVSEYGKLIDSIRQMQPDAKIFIQANLHVTKEKSDNHDYIKNSNIDTFNDKISNFADGKNIFYLDVNPVYDDANGALAEEFTSDGVHLYAKHYIEWADWIAKQSASVLKEG